MFNVLADLRYALRQLHRAPGFALTVVLTLALGVGADTAIFSLLDQALLRSLPVHHPGELVVLQGTGSMWEGHTSTYGPSEEQSFSYPAYRDLRDRSHAFAGLVATAPVTMSLVRGSNTQLGRAVVVSGNYFSVLGVQPALGRLLTQADDTAPGANPVTVLSYNFWRDRLGADPTVVGATVTLNAHPFQVIGVAAPGFRGAGWGQTPSAFVPMSMLDAMLPGKGTRLSDHKDRWLNLVGRLQPGETRAEAQVALAPLWHALRADELKALGHQSQSFTDDFLTRSRLQLLPGARGLSYGQSYYQDPLLIAMAMAALVLLIAAVNVGSLLLVRAAGRSHEFAMRYALGARRGRVVAQLLLEGLLLGAAGAAAGLLLAPVALRALVLQLSHGEADGPFTAVLDGRVLLFNFAVAMAVSVVFSLAPAAQLRRVELTSAMRQVASFGGGRLSFRRAIVVLQIGLSLLLLVGASLFVRTMSKLRAVDVGFNTTHLLTFDVDPQLAGYAPAAMLPLYQNMLDHLAALPGILSVSATNDPELSGNSQGGNVTVAGYTPVNEADAQLNIEKAVISPAYFSTMQIPLLGGRFFNTGDAEGHPLVTIVNQAFVSHFCAGQIARCLGRRMQDGRDSSKPLDMEIVGVVRDTKHRDLRRPVEPTLFQPLAQAKTLGRLSFDLRIATPPEPLMPTVRQAVHGLAPALALHNLQSMDAQIDNLLSNERMIALLSVCFGVLALGLAGIGIYGVLAYATAQRTREIGIRIALGSPRLAIAQLVLRDVLLLAGIGVAVALPVAFALGRLLRAQLFGISPADPFSLLVAVLLIAATALAAALLPVHRAVSVDPTEALRTE